MLLLACVIAAAMFVLFVEAYKLFTSLQVSGYEPAIGVWLMLVSGLFLIGIFTSLPMSLVECLWPAVAYVVAAWVHIFLQLCREEHQNGSIPLGSRFQSWCCDRGTHFRDKSR